MKEMLHEVRCLKSDEDMILALAGQLSDRAVTQKFFRFMRQLLKLSSKCEDHIFISLYFILFHFASSSDLSDINIVFKVELSLIP